MSNNNGMSELEDFVIEGVQELDETAIASRPPKIRYSDKFNALDAEVRAEYLGKLANTMNHAACLIQDERDKLNKLCELKEGQIQTLNEAMANNLMMLQSEVERMNQQRQDYHKNIKQLNAKIRNLQGVVEELTSDPIS